MAKRERLSNLRSTLLGKGIVISRRQVEGRGDMYSFTTLRGVVLFTVNVDDLFDGFGNRFDCDLL